MTVKSTEVAEFNSKWYATAPAAEQNQFRSWLKNLLHTSPVTVSFIKANGSIRVMKCTTMDSYCPAPVDDNSSETNCTVWDIEKSDWRSFKYSQIVNIEFDLKD